MNKGNFPHDKKQQKPGFQGNKPQWPGQNPNQDPKQNPSHNPGQNPNKPEWPQKDKR
jgi:hypothetical protein